MAPKRKNPVQSSCKLEESQSTSKIIKTEVSPGLYTTRYCTRSSDGLESSFCYIELAPIDIPSDTIKAENFKEELSDSETELKVEDISQPPVNYHPVVLLDDINSLVENEHVDDSEMAIDCEETGGDIPENNDPHQETTQSLPRFEFDNGKVADPTVKEEEEDTIVDCEDNVDNRADKERHVKERNEKVVSRQKKIKLKNKRENQKRSKENGMKRKDIKKGKSDNNEIAMETIAMESNKSAQNNSRAQKDNNKQSMDNANVPKKVIQLDIDQNICLYCNKLSRKMMKHLKKAHKTENDIKKALECTSQYERKEILDHVIKLGNFFYNLETLKKGIGRLMLIRVADEDVGATHDYRPCPYCLNFTLKTNLKHHEPLCPDYNASLTESQLPLTKARILFQSRNGVDFVWKKQDTGIMDLLFGNRKNLDNPFPFPVSSTSSGRDKDKPSRKVASTNKSQKKSPEKVVSTKNTQKSPEKVVFTKKTQKSPEKVVSTKKTQKSPEKLPIDIEEKLRELEREMNKYKHWSKEEAKPVLEYFKPFIRTSIRNKTGFKDLPKQMDILEFLDEHKEIKRPWKQIKDFVRNHVVSQRRERTENPLLGIMLGIYDKVDDFNDKKKREQEERERENKQNEEKSK